MAEYFELLPLVMHSPLPQLDVEAFIYVRNSIF